MASRSDRTRSWLPALRSALARKRRLHDWQMLALYWSMEIWTSVVNFANPSSFLSQLFYGTETGAAGMVVFVGFLALSNVLYLYVWLADPGYVVVSLDRDMSPPLASEPGSPEKPADRSSMPVETAGLLKRTGGQQHVTVDVDDQPASTTSSDSNYCYLCDHTIPVRAHHCRHCDRCVAKFDHHCPFLNNCVGARTHGAFTAFCFSQSVVMAYALISSFGMIDLFGASGDAFRNGLYVLTTMGCGFLLMTAAFLFVGHLVLMAKNKTTWEYVVSIRIRQQKWTGQTVRYASPGNYDQGCLKNVVEDCSSRPRPEYVFATRRVRHNAAWDGTDDVEIDTFDAELDSIQPLTVHGLSVE